MTEWLLLGLSLLLVAGCGVFVAAEFALLAVDRAGVERAAAAGDRRAVGVLAALRTLSTQLSGVQVAITVTNLAIGFLAEPALSGLLHAPLAALGLVGESREAVAVALALVVSAVVTMVLGELVPKNLAIALPGTVARVVQRPVRLFTGLMRVPIRLLNRAADAVLGLVGVQAQEELASARSPEELLSLVRHSAAEGTLAHGTAALLARSLTFGDRRAVDVLTPRPHMVTVGAGATVTQLLDVVRRSGRSRLPVTGPGGLDDVVGVVELDRALATPPGARDRITVGAMMRPAVEVPETLPLDEVVRTLRRHRTRLAVVIDEWGGTAGLLTGEDVIEELVGEVDDEYDVPHTAVRAVAGGWEVSGLLRPDEVAGVTGLQLPRGGPFDTVGGLVMHRLGRIPRAGDRLEVAGTSVTVLRMDGRRVDRVRLRADG